VDDEPVNAERDRERLPKTKSPGQMLTGAFMAR